MFDRRSKLLSTVTLLQDLAVTAVAFAVAHLLRTFLVHFEFFSRHLPGIYPFDHYVPLMLAFLLAWAVVGYTSQFYRDLEMSSPIQLVLNLLNQLAIVLVIIYAGLYLFRRDDISRTYLLLVGIVDFVLLLIGRYISYNGIALMRKRLKRYHYFLIVGCGARAREMATLIEESRGMGLRLVGFVDPNSEGSNLGDRFGHYEVFPPSVLEQVLQDRVIDEVVFAVNMQELARLEPLMAHCANVGVKIRVQLEFLPEAYSRIYLENFHDVPLLSLSSAPESELLLFFKRVFDVVLSAVSLVLLAPCLLAIAAAIRITSPGEVLFRQTRCGLGGRRFTLYKFRSMVNNAEQLRAELHQLNELEGPVFKISDDPRITPVGRLLRRFSLDELPQMWNILRGDMSFVGPRPAIPDEVEKYEAWQRRRLRMRPGLTCIWVIEGRSDIEFHRWIQLDLAYIDNWSLWLDAKIFLRTIPIVISGRGAY
ncbi:MAG TPA: sugar transferase [Candidatus Limnocylindrales bacterium]|nr:sugar transferase [Candidatus Limnocylindrales bacterium]